MTQFNLTRVACVAALWLIALASLSTTLAAQSTKVEALSRRETVKPWSYKLRSRRTLSSC